VFRVCIVEEVSTHHTIVNIRDANGDVVVKVEGNRPICNRLVPEIRKHEKMKTGAYGERTNDYLDDKN
jgi:hypothetical protein